MKIVRVLGWSLIAACSLCAGESDSPASNSEKLPGWIFLDDVTVGARALVGKDSSGTLTDQQMQHFFAVSGGVRAGEWLSIHALAATGGDFAGGWNNSGPGLASGSGAVFLKQLYVAVHPLKGAEFQVGGFGVERGVGSDIASYSQDGFMTGARMIIRPSKRVFFDRVSATFGYLGDRDKPGIEHRLRRLSRVNYRQFMVVKNFGDAAAVSMDYTDRAGAKTFRQSVQFKTPSLGVIDSFRVDLYERANYTSAMGGVVSAGKIIASRWHVEAGYAAIDRNYGDWNADAFFHGRRLYAATSFSITSTLSAFLLINKSVGNSYLVPNGMHFHAGFSYDVLKALRGASIL